LILALFTKFGPMHDQTLITMFRREYTYVSKSDAGLRSRRAELVAKNLVQDSGQRITLPSGRKSIVWEAV
jgi:hypothetical protein